MFAVFTVFTMFVMVFCDGVYNVVCNGVCNSVYLDLMRSMKGLQKWSKSGRKKNWLAKSRNCVFGVFISFAFISFVSFVGL